jgi:Ras-related C3 botulinum toxin substrate 1
MKSFYDEYIPPVYSDFSHHVMIEDEAIGFEFWDMADREEYKKNRPHFYRETDIFIFCFSVVSPTSLEHIQDLWFPESQEHCPNAPCILVGLKSDLRDIVAANPDEWKAKGMESVPQAKVEEVKKVIGARAYLECSVKNQINLNEVVETAIKVAVHPDLAVEPPRGGRRCTVFSPVNVSTGYSDLLLVRF